MSLIESNDVVLVKDSNGDFDLSIDENGDFTTADFLDTSLLRAIYGERRALPNEMIIPETRRGWIGNEFSSYEDGSKIWLYEQSPLNRRTLNGVKTEGVNGLTFLTLFNLAKSYTVTTEIDGDFSMNLNISIKRSSSRTDNRVFKLFDNSGVTK